MSAVPTRPGKPLPTIREAWLPSAGFGERKVTLHKWVATRRVRIDVRADDGTLTRENAWEHVFRCVVTGATRRWGIEPVHSRPLPERPDTDQGGN